jgi:hypothetical protein
MAQFHDNALSAIMQGSNQFAVSFESPTEDDEG